MAVPTYRSAEILVGRLISERHSFRWICYRHYNDISETKTSGEYVRITLAEVRKRIESKGISEEEMRKSVYQDNPQYKKPDKGIERIIHRLYHSTSSDLEEDNRKED